MTRVRWSNNDRHFGPFTYAVKDGRDFGIVLKSRGDEDSQAYGRVRLFGLTVLWPLPGWLIRPHREKVTARYWDAETIKRMGRDWYWSVHERAFGFTFTEGALHLYYGKQTNEWPGSKSRCIFLPWREWRVTRDDLFDAEGQFFAALHGREWDERHRLQDACPRVLFLFKDYDGEEITAYCHIKEWDRKLGTGWFKWLSLLRRKQVRRSLDIRFSAEVGPRKGSWKGGTVGHIIEMLPGELHETAFRRYCDQNRLTFVGRGGQP